MTVMGKRSRGVNDASAMSFLAGGSRDTQQHRRLHWAEFARFTARIGHTLESVSSAHDWMLEFFVWFLVAGATKPGTLANYRSALSAIHRAAGQNMSQATSSRTLQLERRDRSGKHRALTQDEFIDLVAAAAKLDEGVAHIMQLMRWLGLRRREALMCGRSLQLWCDMITQGNLRLPVERGAKNKRPRRTEVLEGHVDETLAAIHAALEFCRHRDLELVTGCRDDLESAKSRLKKFFERLPMRRERGSHSLRYTYAVDFANTLLDKGAPPVDVLIALSDRLGHGPSRAKMILDVYCWQVRDRFPPTIRLPSDFVPKRHDGAKNRESIAMPGKTAHLQVRQKADNHRRPKRARRARLQAEQRFHPLPELR